MKEFTWDKAVQFLRNTDPILAKIINNYGPCTLKPQKDYYHTLCDSIISQQLSTKVADTITKRFAHLFEGGKATPGQLMEMDDDILKGVGLSKQKILYLRDLAQKVLDGDIDLDHVDQLSNSEIEVELLKVKGIGPWTVTMFLIFALNRSDVLPVGDLGIKKAIQNQYNLDELPTPELIQEIAQKWHPYETIASWYLWRSLENKN